MKYVILLIIITLFLTKSLFKNKSPKEPTPQEIETLDNQPAVKHYNPTVDPAPVDGSSMPQAIEFSSPENMPPPLEEDTGSPQILGNDIDQDMGSKDIDSGSFGEAPPSEQDQGSKDEFSFSGQSNVDLGSTSELGSAQVNSDTPQEGSFSESDEFSSKDLGSQLDFGS